MTRFQTDRLLIRDITTEDLDSLLKLYQKKGNMKFISDGRYLWSKEQLADKYEKCNRNYHLGFGVFTVILKQTNTIIGEAGLFEIFGDCMKLEAGYILDSKYWKHGFGTEICTELINYSFNKLGIKTLICRMYAENYGSVKLSEKCGMKRVKTGETKDGRTFYEYEILNSNVNGNSLPI